METKKSFRANLEKGKSISFMMGAVVALAVIFTGFEWGAYNIKIDIRDKINSPFDEVEEIVKPAPNRLNRPNRKFLFLQTKLFW